MMELEMTLLGVGTSTGVPVVGCGCAVCRSDDPRDKRLRASALLRGPGLSVVIDTGPEFRLQMLAHGVTELDAVLYTHAHIDHIGGLDDVRPYSFRSGRAVPLYGSEPTLEALRRQFAYIWEAKQVGGGLPKVELRAVGAPFTAAGVRFTPVPLRHGNLPCLGYRVGDAAYLTDLSFIPDGSLPLLEGLETLVLDAVQARPHNTHFNLDEALAAARRIGARQTILTHMNHSLGYADLCRRLPPGITPGYDGLAFRVRVEEDAS